MRTGVRSALNSRRDNDLSAVRPRAKWRHRQTWTAEEYARRDRGERTASPWQLPASSQNPKVTSDLARDPRADLYAARNGISTASV